MYFCLLVIVEVRENIVLNITGDLSDIAVKYPKAPWSHPRYKGIGGYRRTAADDPIGAADAIKAVHQGGAQVGGLVDVGRGEDQHRAASLDALHDRTTGLDDLVSGLVCGGRCPCRVIPLVAPPDLPRVAVSTEGEHEPLLGGQDARVGRGGVSKRGCVRENVQLPLIDPAVRAKAPKQVLAPCIHAPCRGEVQGTVIAPGGAVGPTTVEAKAETQG